MDTLFLGLKKLLVASMFVVFGFVTTYVPQSPVSDVHEAHALASGSIINDPINTFQNFLSTAQETLGTVIGSSDWTKNLSLDGIAWSLAKRAISGMVNELIRWVNSGFEGRPAFVQDLNGFLTRIADEELGRVISSLGEVGSFICSPFRLDVQISIATQYAQYEGGQAGQSAPTCTLTGVIDNIEGFIAGTDPGRGLADWLTITSAPQTFTPYGALLSAEATTRARLINAEGTVLKELDWGSGFQSFSVCEAVSGLTGSQDCSIVTPGIAIQEALTLNLDSGRQMLVQADEINELVGALLGQLANKAITGAAGLLGLSGGGRDDFSGGGAGSSFLDSLQEDSNDAVAAAIGDAERTLTNALRSEQSYRDSSQELLDSLSLYIADAENSEEDRNAAALLNTEIFNQVNQSTLNIESLNDLLGRYQNSTSNERVEIFIEYTNLSIVNDVTKQQNITDWTTRMQRLGIDVVASDILDDLLGVDEEDLLQNIQNDLEREGEYVAKLTYYRQHLSLAERGAVMALLDRDHRVVYADDSSQRGSGINPGRVGDIIEQTLDIEIEQARDTVERLEFLVERIGETGNTESQEIRNIYARLFLKNDVEKALYFDGLERDAARAGVNSPGEVYENLNN